jgi:hypothetical protein
MLVFHNNRKTNRTTDGENAGEIKRFVTEKDEYTTGPTVSVWISDTTKPPKTVLILNITSSSARICLKFKALECLKSGHFLSGNRPQPTESVLLEKVVLKFETV